MKVMKRCNNKKEFEGEKFMLESGRGKKSRSRVWGCLLLFGIIW